jgi:hypothetical protein
LRNDEGGGLRVGDGARNRHHRHGGRDGGRGKQHETKFDHDEYGSRIVRRRTKNEQALGRIVAAFKCEFGFILRGITPGCTIIHDAFRPTRNPRSAILAHIA